MPANPGDVYELPADYGSSGDKDYRPHIVMTKAEPLGRTQTLIYCSKEDTEARLAPPHMVVPKDSPEGKLAGFRYKTFIYPTRLVMATQDDLPDEAKIGVVPDLLTELRDTVLPKALGVTTGTTCEAGLAAGSPRGAIAEFTHLGREDIGCEYGVIVVAPGYGRKAAFWNVIPLINGGKKRPQDPDLAFSAGMAWTKELRGIVEPMLMVRMVRAVYKPEYVYTLRPGVDGEAIRLVDRALLRHFDAQTGTPGAVWLD